MKEGRAIQARFRRGEHKQQPEDQCGRQFAKLMSKGKTKSALQLLSNEGIGKPFHLDERIYMDGTSRSVCEILEDKHPPSQPATLEAIVDKDPEPVHHVVFYSIDAQRKKSMALRTEGARAAGPSGVDAAGWRRLCCSFGRASQDLCESVAATARRLCTCLVDPKTISPILASRLIALDKNPGVRPIGIGELSRRIIAKAVLSVVGDDVQEVTGTRQLCGGQTSGIEAGVHSIRRAFEGNNAEAALLVDAANAFNSLNRAVALQNVRKLCPSLGNILTNCYRVPTDLLWTVIGFYQEKVQHKEILWQCRCTLLLQFHSLISCSLKSNRSGMLMMWLLLVKLANLRHGWNDTISHGANFGYFVNAKKTWLVVKPEHYQSAVDAFDETSVRITTEGRPHLGTPLGSIQYRRNFVEAKIEDWNKGIVALSKVATAHPHAAYAALTHGFSSKWVFLSRVVPGLDLQILEDSLRSTLIPAVTGRLPFTASQKITSPLTSAILSGDNDYSYQIHLDQISAKLEVKSAKRECQQREIVSKSELQTLEKLCSVTYREPWSLHKSAFYDALALRYSWSPQRLPSNCVCGSKLSIDHALYCPKGGFP